MVFLGRQITEQRNYSDEIAYEIDKEIRALIDHGYFRAKKILTDNKDKLIQIAELLIQKETLEGDEFERLFEVERPVPNSYTRPIRSIRPQFPETGEQGQGAAASLL
jgi:cell division protease FtsH